MTRKPALPPTYFAGALVLSLVLHSVWPGGTMIRFPLNLAGFVPIVFGGALNLWADQLFKRRRTTVKPDEKASTCVLAGPYPAFFTPMIVPGSTFCCFVGNAG